MEGREALTLHWVTKPIPPPPPNKWRVMNIVKWLTVSCSGADYERKRRPAAQHQPNAKDTMHTLIYKLLSCTRSVPTSDLSTCYLFFRRLGYKAAIINSVVAQIHNLPDTLNGDVFVGVCEVYFCNLTKSFFADCT